MFEYFKGPQENLRKGALKTLAYLTVNWTRLGVPDPALTLKGPIEAFDTALTAAQDTNTGEEATAHKNRMKKAMVDALRDYANRYLIHNPLVMDEDRIPLGLHIDKQPSKIEPLDEIPFVIVELERGRFKVKYYSQKGTGRMGKPDKAAKLVLYHAILDHEPASLDELVHKITSSKPPLIMTFNEEDRGKKLYFVVCWAIERDDLEGPKSAIMMVIIP
jgi:hypothetical protein